MVLEKGTGMFLEKGTGMVLDKGTGMILEKGAESGRVPPGQQPSSDPLRRDPDNSLKS